MTYAVEANPLAPIPPPGEDELPYSDGEPMESEKHRKQMTLLTQSLELAWDARDDFYVGGGMFLYFSEIQTKKRNDFRGPDVFVVLDTVRRVRKSWVVWQEERTPDVVIELVSATTEKADRGEKMRIYSKVLRVPEYYLYDPETDALEGYRLDVATSTYTPMSREPNGDLVSTRLGLRLGVRPGRYEGVQGNWLRWLDGRGRVLPTGEEQARAAEENARAAEENARAAEERAQDLAARLAEYERRFGKLGGGGGPPT